MNLIDILEKRGIRYTKTNNPSEINIECTSGEHEDRNPSLSFNLDKNIFHCWSCDFNGGINKFLASIGEAPLLDTDSKQPYRIQKLKEKLRRVSDVDVFKLPDDRKLFLEEFRGISASTYKEFLAFTTLQEKFLDYLCIPVFQYGKVRFIEGRLLKDLPNQPKYFRAPYKAETSDCLFPLDKIKNTSSVILVEGIFDMLNMWQLGFHNTLCTFGSTNFSDKKAKILDNRGITRVDIMMDSDISGTKAQEKIANLLDKRNIYSRIITLPAGIDPGELTKDRAEKLLQ